MAAETIYAGPGKILRGAIPIWPEGENGELKYMVEQENLAVASAMQGHMRRQQGDATGKITTKPFDNWGLLPLVFPTYIGATTSAGAGALAIGTLLFGAIGAPVASKIWTPDGRLYNVKRTGVAKPPEMHLGAGVPLYGEMELAAIGLADQLLGSAGFLHAITESGAADPGGVMTMADFIRESWTGAWTGTGFDALESEDEWTVVPQVKWNFYKVQKLTRAAKLASVEFMVKARLVGPTHTQIDGAIGINNGRVLGSSFSAAGADLVLTSQSGKTITLKNADAVGVGFEFGGTKLGTGETGFVNAMTLSAGAPQPLIVFSA